VHDPSYAGWVFDPSHPTQGRRFTNGYTTVLRHAEAAGLTHETRAPNLAHRDDLDGVHDAGYVTAVLDAHESTEWHGTRPDLAHLATLFVGGTLTGLTILERGEARTVAHLPGAKHHAQYDYGSGFCVFADFAIAARRLTAAGARVAILDVDGHHGDGTEALTYDNPDVLTFSIHQWGIFPGTGAGDDPASHVYNCPLLAGDGDDALLEGVEDFLRVAGPFGPDYVFIAGGADGHHLDPLTDLTYTVEGLGEAMRRVRASYPGLPVLFGGAGGYRPDDATPLAWAHMVTALAT